MHSFTDEQWKELDELLFTNQKILLLLQLRELTGLGLHDAMDLMYARYGKLRAEQPERFCCSHEDYWKNFYS